MRKLTYVFYVLAAAGALLGLWYSSVSTLDHTRHLDRQEHGMNCSLAPGFGEVSLLAGGQEGCKTALLSPYSSFWRDRHWGGVPYSLLAMGLFAFALALSVWGLAGGKGHRLAPATFLLLSGLAAATASAVFFSISVSKLHTICTTCAGTYLSSAILLIAAALAFLTGRSDRKNEAEPEAGGTTLLSLGVLAVEMGIATFLPVLVYLSTVPDYTKYVDPCGAGAGASAGTCVCEKLASSEGAGVVTGGAAGGPEAIMVIDPLCPQCEALHRRLGESVLGKTLSYKYFLLPLDAECLDWLLKDSMHPGSCLLSKSLICAGGQAEEMLSWMYDNLEELRKDGIGKQFDAMRQKVVAKFPGVKECIDLPDTKKKIWDSMQRFGIPNKIRIETPQLFVNGKRMCVEDTDLGLEFALARLLGK
ncbi:MAG: hypothetical protein FJ087_05575 [Deltaproteobacteria bacterium]|nr:hypothetical protein [Deltaproteobacteria bacterium]